MLTAFVLGGGGVLGAVEVGMLRALFERDVVPDLVLGTSVGALNGAMVARDPSIGVIDRLTDLWATTARVRATDGSELFRDRPLRTVRRVVATGGTHVFSAQPLRERLVAFAHHSSHDRRHLRTPDQEASVDEAARVLGGDRRATR